MVRAVCFQPVSPVKFPNNRENTGNLVDLATIQRFPRLSRGADSMTFRANSLLRGTGKLKDQIWETPYAIRQIRAEKPGQHVPSGWRPGRGEKGPGAAAKTSRIDFPIGLAGAVLVGGLGSSTKTAQPVRPLDREGRSRKLVQSSQRDAFCTARQRGRSIDRINMRIDDLRKAGLQYLVLGPVTDDTKQIDLMVKKVVKHFK